MSDGRADLAERRLPRRRMACASRRSRLPAAGAPLLVPLAAFLAEPERFLAHDGPLGVEVSPARPCSRWSPISGGWR